MYKLSISKCRILVSLVLLTLIAAGSHAQKGDITYTNSKPIKEGRYRDIKGSPMYFKDWVIGRIMRHDALIYDDVLLNYNGYSHTFEIKTGNHMIELDGAVYLRVDVDADNNPHESARIPTDDFAFQKGLHPRFEQEFVMILFVENDVMLIKQFKVDIAKHKIEDVGKTIEYKDFNRKELFFLKADGKLTQLRFKKKSIISAFDSPEVELYIREHKLTLRSESDLIELAQYYSTLN